MSKINALVITHLGMGDMFVMCGAVRYLRTLYEEVSVVCKCRYYDNIKTMYSDDDNIKLIKIDSYMDEQTQIRSIYDQYNNYGTYDFYLCGLHKSLIYGVPYSDRCDIQKMFYDGLNLDISIMKKYFKVSQTQGAIELVNKIPESMKIIFVHNCASNCEIHIDVTNFKNDNTIIINPNKNMYNPDEKYYSLANEFIDKPLFDYIEIMKKSSELHLVDSSFSCLAGLLLNNGDNTQQKRLYTRGGGRYPELFDSSWIYID